MIALAWLGLAAATEEEVLPDDLEIVRERAEEEEEAPNRGRLAALAGASAWHAAGGAGALQLQVHVSELLAVSAEASGSVVTVLRARQAGRTTVLLPSMALGLALDPVAGARLRPVAAFEATATLWKQYAVAPGGRVRVGVDCMVAGPVALALDAHVGLRVAPGLQSDVNATWSDSAPAAGARAGMVLRW